MKIPVLNSQPWYQNGLKFHCTGCGKCCTGQGGYVFIDEGEAEKIARHLNLSKADFMQKYTARVEGRLVLKDRKNSYDCIFLEDNKCTVYQARPKQCEAFPWWGSNLLCKDTWENLKKDCEGIDHPEGKLYTLPEIESKKK